MQSRLKVKLVTSCSRHDQAERYSDHRTRDIPNKSAMFACSPSYNGCITWETFLRPRQQLFRPRGLPRQEDKDRAHGKCICSDTCI